MKPSLDLYVGQEVMGIERDSEVEWQWMILLRNGVEIRNKDRREIMPPDFQQFLPGVRLQTVIMGEAETILVFSNGYRWGLKPTQYAIHDPRHGGEVYPAWPEELEEIGITSHPDEGPSDKPAPDWEKEERRLVQEGHRRHKAEAVEFLTEEERDAES